MSAVWTHMIAIDKAIAMNHSCICMSGNIVNRSEEINWIEQIVRYVLLIVTQRQFLLTDFGYTVHIINFIRSIHLRLRKSLRSVRKCVHCRHKHNRMTSNLSASCSLPHKICFLFYSLRKSILSCGRYHSEGQLHTDWVQRHINRIRESDPCVPNADRFSLNCCCF